MARPYNFSPGPATLPEAVLACVRIRHADFSRAKPFPARSLDDLRRHDHGADEVL